MVHEGGIRIPTGWILSPLSLPVGLLVYMVPKERFALSRLSALVSKTSVSTVPPLGYIGRTGVFETPIFSLVTRCSTLELRSH